MSVIVLRPDAAAQVVDTTAEPDRLTLPDVLDRVREINPSIIGARLNAEALSRVPAQARSLPDPTVGVIVQPDPVHTARGTQRSQWRAEQMIPFPGKRRLRGEIAELTSDIADEAASALEYDLVFQAAVAFSRLYRIQERLRVLEAFHTEVERFEQAAAVQYEVGRGPQQALLRAQLEKNTLAKRDLQLRAEWQQASRDLARLINDPGFALGQWAVDRPLVLEIPVPDTAMDQVLANRPEVSALKLAATRSDRSLDLAKREYYPDFMVGITYFDIAAESPPPTADGKNALGIGGGIRLPLWRGRLRARKEQAELERRQVDTHLEALETDIAARIAELRLRIQLERDNLNLLDNALVPQAEVTRDATLAAYTTGQVAFIDLLDTERMLFELWLDAIDTRFRLHEAVAMLYRVTGAQL